MNIFSLSFWFKSAVLSDFSVRIFLALLGLLIIVGIFSRLMINVKKRDKPLVRFFKKLSIFSFTMVFIGLVVLFCNYEKLPLLSNRFLFLLWGIGSLVWLGFILKYVFVNMPKLREQLREKAEFEKYLPK